MACGKRINSAATVLTQLFWRGRGTALARFERRPAACQSIIESMLPAVRVIGHADLFRASFHKSYFKNAMELYLMQVISSR
jgi:hypothetical protein